MKRNFLIALIMAAVYLFPGKLSGQQFRGGLKGGLTATEVSGDQAGGPDKLGWFASVYTNMDLRPHSRLQLELMYIQKGSRAFRAPSDAPPPPGTRLVAASGLKQSVSEPGRDYRLYLHYVEIPLVFLFDFSVITGLPYVDRLTGEFGFSGATVVGHYEENEFGLDITGEMARQKPFRRAELNVLAGLHYPLLERLDAQIRFSQGVTPFRAHQGGSTSWYNRGQYNTVWSFGLSYTLFYESGNQEP